MKETNRVEKLPQIKKDEVDFEFFQALEDELEKVNRAFVEHASQIEQTLDVCAPGISRRNPRNTPPPTCLSSSGACSGTRLRLGRPQRQGRFSCGQLHGSPPLHCAGLRRGRFCNRPLHGRLLHGADC